jgi:hypothetical protein
MEAAVRRHRARLAAVGALAVVAGAPPTSGPLLKAVVWMLAILAVVVPVAVHATAASPKSAARPLDLHLVVTMLGAWAAWMAAVAPSSADATPPATSAAAFWWPARAATRLAGLPGSAAASSARRRLS